MAFEIKENSGSLFVNDKNGIETRADRRGSAKIDGVDYWVSGWLKKTKEGKQWLSLSFKPKDQDKLRKVAGGQDAVPEMNDEIPF